METRTMIFEAYKTLEDINGTGLQGIMQTSSEAVPFLPLLLVGAIFVVISFISYSSARRMYGRGDLPASLTVAGLVCVVISVLMSMIPNFFSPNIMFNPVVISIVLEIIFATWLITSRE